MKVYVLEGRTLSKNYQAKRSEFGFDVSLSGISLNQCAAKVARARKLAKAYVNVCVGDKAGLTRGELNALTLEFLSGTWDELVSGKSCDEEVI